MIDSLAQGRRIKQTAEALGMSQRQLAHAAGISQATLSRIVSGSRQAPMGEVVSLAYALGCPVSRLVADQPVANRFQFAHRFTSRDERTNAAPVRERLTRFLEMDDLMDQQGVPRFQ